MSRKEWASAEGSLIFTNSEAWPLIVTLTPARRPLPTAVWLLITLLLGLPLITPLLRWLNVPCTHDGHLHYHRIAAMNFAWDNGIYFTRWLPDLAFGYGYPFFIFREAPPLYLPFLLHRLGLPLPAAAAGGT